MEFIVILVILLVFTVYLGYRNYEVCSERIRVINEIGIMCAKDNETNREWHWRFDVYNEITYDQMLYKFWIPVNRFFKDHKCLQDEAPINQPCEGQQV